MITHGRWHSVALRWVSHKELYHLTAKICWATATCARDCSQTFPIRKGVNNFNFVCTCMSQITGSGGVHFKLKKKYELMLTRRAKAHSSSCLQIVSVYLQSFRSNSLLKCAPQPKIAKINKTPYIGSSGSIKVIEWIQLKSSSLVLVVIGSMPMPICKHFLEKLANGGKITTFMGVSLFDAFVLWFPWT